MYAVKYIENGEEKKEEFVNKDEAFLFQTKLLANRKRNEDGSWNVELQGVWNISK